MAPYSIYNLDMCEDSRLFHDIYQHMSADT
jgi:hypothetical protein